MSIPSTMANVIVEGNTVEAGGAGGAFTYKYMMFNSADSKILNNHFSGIVSDAGAAVMIWLANCTNNVRGNTFVRGSSSINTYIVSTGSNDQIITDNIFDNTTSDGSNTILASGLTANSLYEKNKNQTAYAMVPVGAAKDGTVITNGWSVFESTTGPFTAPSTALYTTSGYLYDMMVLKIFDTTASPSGHQFGLSLDVSSRVPAGAKITDIRISLYNPSGVISAFLTSGNFFELVLSSSRNHTDSINLTTYQSSTTFASWMLSFSSKASLSLTTGNELYPSYQVLEIPTTSFTGTYIDSSGGSHSVTGTDISDNYVVGNDNTILANLRFVYTASAAGSAAHPLLLISPLIITYTW